MTMLLFILYCLPSISLFCLISAAYAYVVNARRAENDPEKREYEPATIWLAPFTWLPFTIVRLLAFIVLLILEVFIFTTLLLLFTLAVFFIRKPFILEWLKKVMLKIGTKLLDANTLLLRGFVGHIEPAAHA